mgnify:CR=1 FL=1
MAALTSLVLALLVLWRPASRLSTHTLGAFDAAAQASALTAPEPRSYPTHAVQTDPWRQMIPWSLVAREELANGRVPLWNRYNGAGAPLLANMQSGIFSPFNLPFYLLPLKFALLASALLKLFVAHFGAARYLRAIGQSSAASLLGASVFAFSGFHLICLQHPHVGVVALLPGTLLFTERSWRSWVSGARFGALAGELAGLAALLGLSVLAGHPEALAVNVLTLALYCVARAVATLRSTEAPRAKLPLFASLLIVAGFAGFLLGAAQLAPFLEYLTRSQAFALRGARMEHLELAQFSSLFVPYLFGAAFDGSLVAARALAPTFQNAMSFCVGPVPLLLVAAALGLAPSLRLGLGIVTLAVLAILIGDGGELTALAREYVLFDTIPALRTQAPWLLTWGVISAVAFDALVERASSRRTATIVGVLFVACAAAGVVVWIGTPAAIASAAARGIDATALGVEAAQRVLPAGGFALVALVGLCAALLSVRTRLVGVGLLVAAHLLATSLPLARHISTTPDRFVAPRSSAIETLTRAAGEARVLFLMHRAPPANSNAWYGISTITSYDALEPHALAQLRDRMFGPQFFAAETLRASPQALQLFGVEFVVTASEWTAIGTQGSATSDQLVSHDPYLRFDEAGIPEPKRFRLEIDEHGARQEFEVERMGFDGYALRWLRDARVDRHCVELELEDLEAKCLVDSRAVELGELRDLGAVMLENVVRFAPRPDSAGRKYALRVRTIKAHPGAGPQLLRLPTGAESDEPADAASTPFRNWRLTAAERPQRGRIVLDVSADTPFETVERLGEHDLKRFVPSRGRAWIVPRAEFHPGFDEVFERVLEPSFDPYASVVLCGVPARTTSADAGVASIEWLDDDPDRLRWSVDSGPGAWLVISRPHYPGWVARIDGVESRLERANYAFLALELPGGAREVELRYEAPLVRLSLWCSALMWVGVLAVLGFVRRASR